jgi:mannose-6-phosphate isomerase-like protein (cupin superfamily)
MIGATFSDRAAASNEGTNYPAAVEHRRIYRPWGYYQDVDLAARYCVKRIVVKPGNTLSLQKHFHRSEHWVVVKGTAEVTLASEARIVHENESISVGDVPIRAVKPRYDALGENSR